MRSKLFVPGSRPELFEKALATDADAFSFDLEDAVQETRKDEARRELSNFLKSMDGPGKRIIVRINGLSTKHWRKDIAEVVHDTVDAINVPKLETPEDVSVAAEAIQAAEAANGVTRPIGILANIESPKGLRRAAEIAQADPRVIGLQLGFGDLFEPLGIDRNRPETVAAIQLQLRLAAGEAGLPAYDSAYTNVGNPDGFRAEATVARRLGLSGKSCIHPSQVAAANEVFAPSEDEIAEAITILKATREANKTGLGAFVINGRMIDGPFIESARAVLQQAGLSEDTVL